jgi:hypothetical protein
MSTFASLDVTTLSFVTFNILRLASYLPQIIAVARDPNGATAISLSCWTIWVGANAATGIYAWLKLGDPSLAAISACNAASCAAVLVLAAYKRVEAVRSLAPGMNSVRLGRRCGRPEKPFSCSCSSISSSIQPAI